MGVELYQLVWSEPLRFELRIEKASFSFSHDQQKVEQEAALDGIYVLRTPLMQKSSRRPISCAATSP